MLDRKEHFFKRSASHHMRRVWTREELFELLPVLNPQCRTNQRVEHLIRHMRNILTHRVRRRRGVRIVTMTLEGKIVEFLDADTLRIGYVRKQERDRLHVVDPRGRNLSVNGDHVVVVHRPAPEGEFPAIAREITEKVAARQSEVDVELLWQSLGGSQHEMEPAELAELFFAEITPEA